MRDISLGSVIAAIGILVTASVGILAAYTAYDLSNRGSIPQKQVQVDFTGPIDLFFPLRAYSESGVNISIDAKLNGEILNNLYYELVKLSNVGQAPILQSDIYRSITINVRTPWRILAVSNPGVGTAISFVWNHVSDTEYRAEPTLLNPGDIVLTGVYITNTQYANAEPTTGLPPNQISVAGRIVNMRNFSYPANRSPYYNTSPINLSISVYGWGIPISILLITFCEYSYLFLFSKFGLMSPWRSTSILLVLASSMLSIAAAESSVTYLFGRLIFSNIVDRSVNNYLNAPWILINIAILLSLTFVVTKRSRRI